MQHETRWREVHPALWLGLGIALGALGAALADPQMGRTRRARIRDKAHSFRLALADAARRRSIDARQRLQGALHEVRARRRGEAVPDHILEERVRAQIGRPVTHPRALEVRARDGVVEVRGPVLAHEVGGLLAAIRRVRGVRDVLNRIDVHDEPRNVPSLQGPGSRQAG